MAPASGSSEARQIAGIATTTALEPPLEVHSLPFRIRYDGACPVREGEKVALSGLHGGGIGTGMEGLVIRDDSVSGRFDGITVWNAGRGLSEADEVPQVMHFLSTVAPALHGPV
eukprot:g5603.t1